MLLTFDGKLQQGTVIKVKFSKVDTDLITY